MTNEYIIFFNSDFYKNIIHEFERLYGFEILSFDEVNIVSIMSKLNNEVRYSKINHTDICNFLENYYIDIMNFSFLNIDKFLNQNKNTPIKCSPDIFYIFAIRYHIMKYNPEYFEEYSKKMRMPGAKQYTKQVKKIYEQVINENN